MPTITGQKRIGPASASVPYGPAFNLDALQNVELGSSINRSCSHRFRSPKTATITSIWGWLKNYPGYGLGDGGTIKAELQSDNAGLPSGTVVGTGVNADGPNVSVNLIPATWSPLSWNVTENVVYHIVYTNVAADPASNFCSINNTMVYNAIDPYQPRWPDNSFETLAKTGTGAWAGRFNNATPLVGIGFNDGTWFGSSVYDYNQSVVWGGATMLRERFTVSGASRSVTGVALRVAKTNANTGTAPLIVRLEQSDGTLLESISVSTGSVPQYDGVSAGENIWYGVSGEWLTGSFTQTHTLVSGTTYNVRFSIDASTSLWVRPIKYNGPESTWPGLGFTDGLAQYSVNSASTWDYLPSATTNCDLQMYLTTA